MRRMLTGLALALSLAPGPASAGSVSIQAVPNPAQVRDRVTFIVDVMAFGRLHAWISAGGFERPVLGSLPMGSWRLVCCPAETGRDPAWRYDSTGGVRPGSYRFGATARVPGRFLSTARVGTASAWTWMSVT